MAAVSEAPCILPNENMFCLFKEGVETLCKQLSLRGSLSLPWLLFTVTTLLHDFKLKSLSINSLDLDKVMSWKAHRQLALLAVVLSLTVSVTVTGPVFDASLWVFICFEERYGLVLCAFSISAIPHFWSISVEDLGTSEAHLSIFCHCSLQWVLTHTGNLKSYIVHLDS